jgi:hypothetical protein
MRDATRPLRFISVERGDERSSRAVIESQNFADLNTL